MKCRKCNRSFDDQLNYCPFCGEKAEASSETLSNSEVAGVRRITLNLPKDLTEEQTAPAKAVKPVAEKKVQAEAPKPVKPVEKPKEAAVKPVRVREIRTASEETKRFTAEETREIMESERPSVKRVEEPAEETSGEDTLAEIKEWLKKTWAAISAFLVLADQKITRSAKIAWKKIREFATVAGKKTKEVSGTAGKNISAWTASTSEKTKVWLADRKEKRALAAEEKARLEEEDRIRREEENLLRIKEETDRAREEARLQEEQRRSFIPADTYFDQTGKVEEPYRLEKEEPYEETGRLELFGTPEPRRTLTPETYADTYTDSYESYYEDYREEEPAPKRTYQSGPLRNAFEWLVIRIRPAHIAFVVLVAIAIGVYFFVQSLGSPTKDFAAALSSRNYTEAARLYSDKYEGNEELEGSSQADLAAYLSQLKQNAIDGQTTYSATDAALAVIKNSDLYTNGYKTLVDETESELTILKQADSLYTTAVQKQNDLNYSGAIEDFNQVMELYSSYRDTPELLARARDNYRDSVVQDVGRLQNQNNFTEAGNRINEALDLMPNDPVLANLKESNESKAQSSLYQSTFTTAERYFQSGDYPNVLQTVNAAIEQDPADSSLVDLREDYEIKLAESLLNTADNIFLQGDRERALAKVQEGLDLLPDNALLLEARNRYSLELDPDATVNPADPGTETPDPTPAPPDGDVIGDNLPRSTYTDAAGDSHTNSVVQNHTFTGNMSVVDQIIFRNDGAGTRYTGELALGQATEYTQVYYQIYSNRNPSAPLRDGSLIARVGEDPGNSYKISVDLNAANADYFIVNLNYLQGGEISVIMDLNFTR